MKIEEGQTTEIKGRTFKITKKRVDTGTRDMRLELTEIHIDKSIKQD